MRKPICWVLLFSLVLLGGCSIKPRGWESEGVIAVMADQDDWTAVEPNLRKAFEKVIRTPQMETTYTLRFVKPDEFKTYTEYRKLILLATLESQGPIGDIVNRVIAHPEIRAQVERGERFYIVEENQWAKDQLMLILVAKDIESLKTLLLANDENVYRVFDEALTQQLEKEMFDKKEQVDLEDRLMRTYNWNLRLQHDYFVAQEFPAEGFVWFRRLFPERWIFVRWIDGGTPDLLTQDWVVSERNRIGLEYYGGDQIAEKYLFSYRGEFLGRPAQITQGLWENDDKVAGGPFKNYTFYDQNTQRIYMIDLAIFAPERDKMPYIKRHEIIAHSFKTIFDVEID